MLVVELALKMYNDGDHLMNMTTEQVEYMDDFPEVIDTAAEAIKELFKIAEKAQLKHPSGFDHELP